MKKRINRVLNFFAFNLLFFALYLNFVHKDNTLQPAPVTKAAQTASVKGTILVTNPSEYLSKNDAKNVEATAQLKN